MTLATINTSIVSPITESNDSNPVRSEKFKVAIQVLGIKKRCRKSEYHISQLGFIDYNNGSFDRQSVVSLVRDFVAVNMKEIKSVIRIYLDHTKVKSENGFTSTLWEPFSDKSVRFDITL